MVGRRPFADGVRASGPVWGVSDAATSDARSRHVFPASGGHCRGVDIVGLNEALLARGREKWVGPTHGFGFRSYGEAFVGDSVPP
jgi:hypothetical protein